MAYFQVLLLLVSGSVATWARFSLWLQYFSSGLNVETTTFLVFFQPIAGVFLWNGAAGATDSTSVRASDGEKFGNLGGKVLGGSSQQV